MTATEETLQLSGQDDIFQLTKGYYTIRALLALWRLGLLERATRGEALELNAVAAELGTDADQLKPLLDYLIVRGFLENDEAGAYRLTARGSAAIPYYGYLGTMIGAYEPVIANIEGLVTGKLRYGSDVTRGYEEMVRGLTALEDNLMDPVADVAQEGSRRVLDLGCGSARMLARICELNEGISGVGVDRNPDSCATARETVARAGLEGRLTIVQADAADLNTIPRDVLAGVDMISVMFLLHEILRQKGRDGVIGLLRQIADAIGPGGKLVMVEVSGTTDFTYRENQLFVPEYELLHEYTNQRLAARPEWEAMVAEAGMKVADIRPVNMCQSFCLVATPVNGAGA
ncbi:MAG TPA: class I SAM-dependent methyltransferase [Streptosporangiaceae bacterium]|jgi:SAM-dependent methyltransferase